MIDLAGKTVGTKVGTPSSNLPSSALQAKPIKTYSNRKSAAVSAANPAPTSPMFSFHAPPPLSSTKSNTPVLFGTSKSASGAILLTKPNAVAVPSLTSPQLKQISQQLHLVPSGGAAGESSSGDGSASSGSDGNGAHSSTCSEYEGGHCEGCSHGRSFGGGGGVSLPRRWSEVHLHRGKQRAAAGGRDSGSGDSDGVARNTAIPSSAGGARSGNTMSIARRR